MRRKSAEQRMIETNAKLEAKGSNLRIIGNYTNSNEPALFKCNKCGVEYTEKVVNVKNILKCKHCEMKQKKNVALKKLLEEKKDKWTLISKKETSFYVECNKCGKKQILSKHKIMKDKDECCCSSKQVLGDAKKEAQQIYAYMIKEISGYGLLEGEELHDYIRDVLRIESPVIAESKEFCDAVIDAMYDIYEKRKVKRCSHCGRLYPASRLYNDKCMKKYSYQCVA